MHPLRPSHAGQTAPSGLPCRWRDWISRALPCPLHRPFDGRPGHDGLEPALEVGKVIEILALVLVGPHPAYASHVGDRIVASQELPVRQALVHDAIEPVALIGVAVDGVWDLLRRILTKMMRLPGHRTEAAHLPEKPLVDLDAGALVRRIELPELAAEILKDGAGLEDRDRLAALAPRDRRSPACGCWARSSGTTARTARHGRC